MDHLDLVQGSPEWHAHRITHDNASDAPAVLNLSKYKTRNQLLHERATGIGEEITPEKQALFDEGHRTEKLALSLAEKFVGEELYPVVGVLEGSKLSASFDGLTMSGKIASEHKMLNAGLRACLDPSGRSDGNKVLDMMYQVQMEQQCMVSGAEKVLFIATKWTEDGQLADERHCWYYANPVLAERIRKGWAQFHFDLEHYEIPRAKAAPAEAVVIPNLPALVIQLEGKVSTSNLDVYRKAAETFIAKINTDLKTDQHFADAENTIKFCEKAEERLALVKEAALSQTHSIAELFDALDSIKESIRQKRLTLQATVKTRKENIRGEIVAEAQLKLDAHVRALNERLGTAWLPRSIGAFADAIKNKRTVESLQNAADAVLAQAKIDASAKADLLQRNHKATTVDGVSYAFLFTDFATVGTKPHEDFDALVSLRVLQEKERQKKLDEDRKAKEDAAAAAALVVAQPPAVAPVLDAPTGAPAGRSMFADTALAPSPSGSGSTPDTRPPITTTELNVRLGFVVTADLLKSLGVVPVTGPNARGVYWKQTDWGFICIVLRQHLQKVQEQHG